MSNKVPDKIVWHAGYNTLSILMDQERKHWLMKVNANKTVQDKDTGDMFKGVIDNTGGEIVLSTEKLNEDYSYLSELKFNASASSASDIIEFANSAFPYSPMVNGFMFGRIKASKYTIETGDVVNHYNYAFRLKNCTEVSIPFGISKNNKTEVINTKWIRTTTTPEIILYEDATQRSTVAIPMVSEVTNVVYYYPLTQSIQPLPMTKSGTTYTSSAVISDTQIGYPLYWFTCDNSNIGPTISFTNNTNINNDTLVLSGMPGMNSKYSGFLYVNVDGTNDATPDATSSVNYKIYCHPFSGEFSNNDSDFSKPLAWEIGFFNTTNDTETLVPVSFSHPEDDVITMVQNESWEYINSTTYGIDMSVFDNNCVENEALIPVFKYHLYEFVPFMNTTLDTGYAGIQFSSMNPDNDILEKYPFNLNKWDGLPTWLSEESSVREYMAMYAIHNTPSYQEEDPTSRQTTGLLFDLGYNSPEATEDEAKGRIYYISNDPCEYDNNQTSEHPKPGRTLARICDIPTTVVQLTNITGLAPSSIVDKKYVRTEADYSNDDKERVWNTLKSRWVRPCNLDVEGNPISTDEPFIFTSEEDLNKVDLVTYNDFRYHNNINNLINVGDVKIHTIEDGGSGYTVLDTVLLVIGGFSFTITVTEVDSDGSVVACGIGSDETDVTAINISNFDLADSDIGITEVYGTSPRSATGTGLRVRIGISNYQSYKPTCGGIYEDIFAIVKISEYDTSDDSSEPGLYFYKYEIPSPNRDILVKGNWVQSTLISKVTKSTSRSSQGALSIEDAYVNGIVPTNRVYSIQQVQSDQPAVGVLGAGTNTHIALYNNAIYNPFNLDINKFYSHGAIYNLEFSDSEYIEPGSIANKLSKIHRLYYDSFILWRISDDNHKLVYYTYIQRSLNNDVTTDSTTRLPRNDVLDVKDFVNTNPATTVTWNTDSTTFVFVFDPTYTKHERYSIDSFGSISMENTTPLTWEDVDIQTSSDPTVQNVKLFDDNGLLQWNIFTTNPTYQAKYSDEIQPLTYPGCYTFADWGIGTHKTQITHQPMGDWRLVLPKLTQYQFINPQSSTAVKIKPKPMNILKYNSTNQTPLVTIADAEGNNISDSAIVIDKNRSTGVTQLKIYDSSTNTWKIL